MRALLMRGGAYLKGNQAEKALADFNCLVELNPYVTQHRQIAPDGAP